jgi:nucleoside-diphosphate-sugar epimerase
MNIGITGASGFIGQHLLHCHYEKGDSVRILLKNPDPVKYKTGSAQLYTGNLIQCDSEDLIPFVDGLNVLYHCAGEINNQSIMYNLHVKGTGKLIEAASGRIGRWVQLSSVGVYGPFKEGTITEEYAPNPQGCYEETKVKSDSLVRHAMMGRAFDAVIVQPANVFGPTMSNSSLFQLIGSVYKGIFCYIGSSEACVNYIPVANVIAGLMLCATHANAKGNTYILSNTADLKSFIETIARHLNKPAPRHVLPEYPVRALAGVLEKIVQFPLTTARIDALTSRVKYSSQKIRSELNYNDAITVEDGLHEMCDVFLKLDKNKTRDAQGGNPGHAA